MRAIVDLCLNRPLASAWSTVSQKARDLKAATGSSIKYGRCPRGRIGHGSCSAYQLIVWFQHCKRNCHVIGSFCQAPVSYSYHSLPHCILRPKKLNRNEYFLGLFIRTSCSHGMILINIRELISPVCLHTCVFLYTQISELA